MRQIFSATTLFLIFFYNGSLLHAAQTKPTNPKPPPGPKNPNAPGDDGPVGAVAKLLKSADPAQLKQGVNSAIKLLEDGKTGKTAANELPNWFSILLTQKRLNEIEEIAMSGISAQPSSLKTIEVCQKFRVRACLVSGKVKDGLSLAKALYNVCSMATTSQAIDLVSECLYDDNKDSDPAAVVKKYKTQQVKGAEMPEKGEKAPDAEKPMLADVQVDGKGYENAIVASDLNADGLLAMLGKGNLYLLSDKPKEAKKVFEKAYALASDKDLPAVTEAIARAMRAEDGTVGRANAWILSLRPQDGGK